MTCDNIAAIGHSMPDRQKRVLVLSTIGWFTIHLVRAAALCGFRPYVVTDRRWGLDRLSVHARRRLVVDRAALARGDPGVLDEINRFIESNRIDVVVPADTRCTRMLTVHGGTLRRAAVFPLPTAELFDRLGDKWSFYQLLVEHGVPTPQCSLVDTPEAAEAVDIGCPVVVKPRRGENADGVRRIDTRSALRADLRSAVEQGGLPVIVQEWVGDRDIGLSLCAEHGELSSWLVQVRETAGMRFIEDDRVVALGRTICGAVAYHGVGHLDMRRDERTGAVWVLEFNPRFWGSVNYATWLGVNFLAAGMAILDGSRSREEPSTASGMCPYLASTPGTLVRWIRNGFRSPGSTPAQRRAWTLQLLDPLPEWADWGRNHLGLTRLPGSRRPGTLPR